VKRAERPPKPTTRIVLDFARAVVHYPTPGLPTPMPLCGHFDGPKNIVPAKRGERLCLKCKAKADRFFDW
jgi:hypothetical protein